MNRESCRKRRSGGRDTRGIVSVGLLFAFWNCWRSGLASISVWIAPLRPWLLGAAVLLLVLGFWQIYRRPNQCSTRQSPVSVVLFWIAVGVVMLVIMFPQLLANWIAG